jgi:hypothetical protein
MTAKKMTKERTRDATVSLPTAGGQGILVPGRLVLTAAHCVESYASGGMALGEHCLEVVQPKVGQAFRLSVYAVDPVADIAVLGEPDNQVFDEDAVAFESFCEATEAVPISADDFETEAPVRVSILTHHDTWIAATATRYGPASTGSTVTVVAEHNIEGGTSGGPVIDEAGQLVGVVSVAGGAAGAGGGEGDTRQGMMPRPHLALPIWVWRRIAAAQGGEAARGEHVTLAHASDLAALIRERAREQAQDFEMEYRESVLLIFEGAEDEAGYIRTEKRVACTAEDVETWCVLEIGPLPFLLDAVKTSEWLKERHWAEMSQDQREQFSRTEAKQKARVLAEVKRTGGRA